MDHIKPRKKIHRFICDVAWDGDAAAVADAAVVHQMAAVLKLKPGEEVWLSDGRGSSWLCQVENMARREATFRRIKSVKMDGEPAHEVTLYCALLKRDCFEEACREAVQAGASAIVPLVTDRTVKLGLNLERLRTLLREAAELAERSVLPSIQEPVALADAMAHAQANDVNYFFEPGGDIGSFPLPAGLKEDQESIGVFIGPEGGWSETELEAARNAHQDKFIFAGLGPCVMRAETAATVATYLAANLKVWKA